MTDHYATAWNIGDWCYCPRQGTPCRVVERQEMWGGTVYRVWLPAKDTLLRVRAADLAALETMRMRVEEIVHATACAKLLDALEDQLLLSPIQSGVVPLPHQLYALKRAMSGERVRYLLADEVGLGKTIEAGLILRELKLRGRAKRILVVAPKGLVRQWQAEMWLHFGEKFRFIEPSDLAAFRQWRSEDGATQDNLWLMHDQVICSLDSVKPLEGRRGWSAAQLETYNRERFEDLVAAHWDLVIIDEAHRLGGSTEQVARYQLGAALAEATPDLLLLSATPHQGKTDQFMRLMQLLDGEAFPDERSVRRERVQPFVIRTEKRAAVNAEGNPLFLPRMTRLQAVSWQARHSAQRQLYEAVSDYVRHGYNQAMAQKQRHIGFLMILMQRLVTSSTAAIRAMLEKRQEILNAPPAQMRLFTPDAVDEWADLDGQSQLDWAAQLDGWEREQSEVAMLLDLARQTEAAGTDAKAEALLELMYTLQQEENNPTLKVLIFTEFVSTQTMLADYLASRGFSVVMLNGSMDLDARTQVQQAFAEEARVLISTDAGGEGLNLQFCHVIVNFDMPWNPMRIEQRIGRVDRIGQKHVVRAINLVLEDTVEHRVRQVLEEKLEVIAQEFGVDKAADVMDCAEAEPLFEQVFVQGLNNPAAVEQECDALAAHLRTTLVQSQKNSDLLGSAHALNADDARKWRDHPAQFWLERAISNGLVLRGGTAAKNAGVWRIQWTDGSVSKQACFDARSADEHPQWEWITLEDPRARALIGGLPRCVAGQPLPAVRVTGLLDSVCGIWSLWAVGLAAEGLNRRRFFPVFVNEEGRTLMPTAKRIWDLLLTENVSVHDIKTREDSAQWFAASHAAAMTQGEEIFNEMLAQHRLRLKQERERALYAFASRNQAIERIGLPEVREYRRRRLQQEHAARMSALDHRENSVPEMYAVLMLHIGA